MSIVLIGSSLLLISLLFMKPFLLGLVSPMNKIARKLETAEWFQHPRWSGVFLFALNTLLFSSTAASLFLLSFFSVPYVSLLIMVSAIIVSLLLWISIYHADQKSRRGRLEMGLIGSSFYVILFGFALFRIFSLTAHTSEQDQFMEFIGLFFVSIIALTAWIVCLAITGLYRKHKVR